jgi:hypothetical protein
VLLDVNLLLEDDAHGRVDYDPTPNGGRGVNRIIVVPRNVIADVEKGSHACKH